MTPINYYNAVPKIHAAYFFSVNQIDSLNDFVFQPIGEVIELCVTITLLGFFRL